MSLYTILMQAQEYAGNIAVTRCKIMGSITITDNDEIFDDIHIEDVTRFNMTCLDYEAQLMDEDLTDEQCDSLNLNLVVAGQIAENIWN